MPKETAKPTESHTNRIDCPSVRCRKEACLLRSALNATPSKRSGDKPTNRREQDLSFCCAMEMLYHLVYSCSDVPAFLESCRSVFERYFADDGADSTHDEP